MTLAVAGSIVAWLAALGGLTLAVYVVSRRPAPRWLVWLHPAAGTTALVLLWVAFTLWPGPRDLPLDAGIIALTLAFVAGSFMFSLRATCLPVPVFAIALHALAALSACALLIVGLLHASLQAAG
ncbi:MAG: hypothetical protein L0I62_01105 [Gammaproteobacteria bacterium]|nr:hypothetical protein [Gammaproteobacteria bacterium]